jgi:putative copper export protein
MDLFWRWLHLVAAAFWLGGLLMLAIVTLSSVRVLERQAFGMLIRRVGRTFLAGSVIAWVLLGVSGVGMTLARLHSAAELSSTSFGRILSLKTGFFLLAILLTIAHTIAGARSTPAAIRLSRMLSPLIFVLTLAIFYLAVVLTQST